jgi:hypothetical protein
MLFFKTIIIPLLGSVIIVSEEWFIEVAGVITAFCKTVPLFINGDVIPLSELQEIRTIDIRNEEKITTNLNKRNIKPPIKNF